MSGRCRALGGSEAATFATQGSRAGVADGRNMLGQPSRSPAAAGLDEKPLPVHSEGRLTNTKAVRSVFGIMADIAGYSF